MFQDFNNKPDFPEERNGTDELSLALGLCALISFIIYPVFLNKGLYYFFLVFTFLLIAIILFRFFSTNLIRRRKENEAFLHLLSFFKIKKRNDDYAHFEEVNNEKIKKEEKVKEKEKKREKKRKEKEEAKLYSFFNCPSCKEKIRVPKGKGKIRITCPSCGTKFEEKT